MREGCTGDYDPIFRQERKSADEKEALGKPGNPPKIRKTSYAARATEHLLLARRNLTRLRWNKPHRLGRVGVSILRESEFANLCGSRESGWFERAAKKDLPMVSVAYDQEIRCVRNESLSY
jgi:hypothetical protein